MSSNRSFGFVKQKFPQLYVEGSVSRPARRNPDLPVVSKGLPPYPSESSAIIENLGLDFKDRYGSALNASMFVISAPDYRCRIDKMRILSSQIQLQVETKAITDDEVFAQFFIDGQKEPYVEIEKGRASVSYSSTPREIFVVVLQKETGEMLDYLHYNVSRFRSEHSNVEWEIAGDIVKQWIHNGENEQVEFKEVLKDSNDLVESIVAFANTNGGVILIGVANDGSVSGHNESLEDVKERLENIIAEKCDPPIQVEVDKVNIGNYVTVVKIPKGSAKVYAITNAGIYVRRGSTDRHIKPSELEERFSSGTDRPRGAI